MSINLINGELLFEMFKQGTNELSKNKALIDALNVFPVPDGDTGTNMSLTMNSALNQASGCSSETVEEVSKAIAKGSLLGARGNSGVILSQIFRGFAKGCEGKISLNKDDFVEALNLASETAYKAVLKPVEGTILTVIRKTAERAEGLKNESFTFEELITILVEIGKETLDSTPEYLDVLKQAGVVDAGGKGLLSILEGFAYVIMGNKAEEIEKSIEEGIKHNQSKIDPSTIKFTYCTEFIIKANEEVGDFKEKIQRLGDSMVYVKDDDLIKVHVHTNNPGIALEKALLVGELISVKIENMKEQHSSIIEDPKVKNQKAEEKYGFISVAMGDGISSIFKDFGVEHIIEGGQTMNPSTEDIVEAIKECSAKNIFILPNNSNIILAANQAKELTDKNVYVVPSKSVPQGISSMIVFDRNKEAEENFNSMLDNLKNVKTLQITFSVRDTVFDGMEIKEDDILGIEDGMISSTGKDVKKIAIETIEKAIDEDSEILTIYYGEDITESKANELREELEKVYDDIDIEVYYGGQPLYYYIFSIE